jgi:hypothetical protein
LARNPNYDEAFIAPLYWVKVNVEYYKKLLEDELEINFEEKLMFGLPFYGYLLDLDQPHEENHKQMDYTGLRKFVDTGKFKYYWDEENRECVWEELRPGGARVKLYFPCHKFVRDRIELFSSQGVGVSVWDGGQGNPDFYEFL